MASIAFPDISRSILLPNGTTYNYVFVESRGDKPFLLFIHGYPSSSYDWRHQIHFFSDLGYGLIVPDLLGYGGTDKPQSLEAYRGKKMSEEINALLDVHKIPKVLGIGHDWGSWLLSRLANYFPERFSAFAWLDVGYRPPAGHFSLETVNEATAKLVGHPIAGYWYFHSAPDAADLLTNYPDVTESLYWPEDPLLWKEYLCAIGGMRRWFDDKRVGKKSPWISDEEFTLHRKIFSASNGGYAGGLNWYNAHIANLNTPDDEAIPKERYYVEQPTLLVTCSLDMVGVPSLQVADMGNFVKNLQVENLECSHWLMLEKRSETNQILKDFFEKVGK
ncbi:MAG: hypothetical protein LQ351_002735 [Letrouitia transgressa]|nr:MAG: hypothetical protein LQ351_002735 [Letrouitia transgressa]